jgi:uncharacterized membrane protein YozB (DUF420 family)
MERKPSFDLATGALMLVLLYACRAIMNGHTPTTFGGWTTTQYDFVQIVSYALGIGGVILVLEGLIRTWRTPTECARDGFSLAGRGAGMVGCQRVARAPLPRI